jgi:hypothetical protein
LHISHKSEARYHLALFCDEDMKLNKPRMNEEYVAVETGYCLETT